MHLVQYRQWAPPQSPLRIEFPSELLREVGMESGGREANGVLFGFSHERELRLLSARRSPDGQDPRLAGLKPLGVFVWRPRGEVFLTEGDLEHFEKSRAAVALVVAGPRAGFFVREANGSLQAIRTHEEFPVVADVVAASVADPPAPEKIPRPMDRTILRPASAAAALALALGTLLYWSPAPAKSLALTLKEQSGQLLVTWNPRALPRGGRLDISDGNAHVEMAVSPAQSSATYQLRGGDVEVRLGGEQRRIVLSSKQPTISQLERQAEELRKLNWRGNVRVAELEVLTGRLSNH